MTKIFPEDLAARLATRAIHAGQRPDATSGAIMPPIYQTSTYAQEALGVNKGYEYARGKNPTREALERNVAALEGAQHGFAFSSGMGCLNSLMMLFKTGDHIVIGANVYGGTFRLFDKLLQHFGLSFTWVDMRDPQHIADAMTKKTVAVMLETPTNPLMQLADIKAAAEIAKKAGALTIVDNTFATPIFQSPLLLGADIVWHSSTKYLNGHSDLIGGVAVTNNDELAAKIQFIANSAGAVPGPMDAWLTLRGTKTLALRMRAHDANGRQVADWLAKRVGAEQVFYPGLASHPQHELAKRQMSGFGGMVSVETGSKANANTIVTRLKVFTLAESLGGVESLVCQPAGMTHASVDPARRAEIGITDGLLRFSCGVEDPQDLLEDLEQAFKGL
ncbi:MAG: aminotransferase class V-fold PLP-dependent enzyme [Gemmatimonadaceae bacterium]|nr:aminotransferase class V-fold PLP-dependent enzyme [Gemmatimonadaceae bacterium]